MNKKALSLAVCLAISYSSATYALGLGEIESSSHLNQPFRAKINLLSTTAKDAKNLKVKVASPEVFSRVGIDRPAYLDTINFRSDVENGKPVIRVSSSQPINQPFLNFLIEVSWPSGQLLKEYTVLLDPPVLVQPGTAVANNSVRVRAEPKSQKPAQAAVRQNPRRVQANNNKRTVDASNRKTQPARTNTAQSNNRSQKYRVVRGDTLYKVAKKLGYSGVQTEQMMMALFRANPTAFRKRNVNNLKAGAVMRRPSAQDARSIPNTQAKSMIYRQSSDWRKYRTNLAKNTVPQDRAGKSTNPSGNSSAGQGAQNNQARMEVVGSSSTGVDTKNLTATGAAQIADLERKLLQANESLSAKENANTELKSRVTELESLLRKKNRLITLKNEQLAEMQARLGVPASGEGAMATAESDEGTDISQQVNNANNQDGSIIRGNENDNPVQEQQPVPGSDVTPEQQMAMVDNPNALIDEPSIFEQIPDQPGVEPGIIDDGQVIEPPVEQQPAEEQMQAGSSEGGLIELLSSPMVMGLGGGSLLALFAGWLLMRRKSRNDYEDYDEIDFEDPEMAPGSSSSVESKHVDRGNGDDAFAGLDGDFDDMDLGTTDSESKVEELTTVEGSSQTTIVDNQEDILQEADVYIVYGLHDQAEVELKKAIEKDPGNLRYHGKLLENYHASSNVEAFNQQAELFSRLPDDSEGNKSDLWSSITEWGHELKSDSSLFSDGPSDNSSTGSIAGAATAAVAAGGIAVTAGKAIAEDKLDGIKDFFDGSEEEAQKDLDASILDASESVSQESDFDLDLSEFNDEIAKHQAPETRPEIVDAVKDAAEELKDDQDINADDLDFSAEKQSIKDDLDLEELLRDDSDPLGVNEPDEEIKDLDAEDLNDLLDDHDTADIDRGLDLDLGSAPVSDEIDNLELTTEDTPDDDLILDIEQDLQEPIVDLKQDDLPEPVMDLDVDKPETDGFGEEFEDLLDLDLSDLGGDLSNEDKPAVSSSGGLGLSNLNLELNNDDDLNKILPTGNPYTSAKDDVKDASSLLGDLDDDLSFMDLDQDDQDLRETQVSTKLDLARAYLDMGDIEGARNTLEEVLIEGNDDQKREAEELLHQTG